MTASFSYFHDAALTRPITAADPLRPVISTDATRPSVDLVIYLGSPAAAKRVRASSNPGVAPIVTSVWDPFPAYGAPSTVCTLAASAAGLDTATPGAALDHGMATLLSGAANAIAIWVRFGPHDMTGLWTDVAPACCVLLEDPAP